MHRAKNGFSIEFFSKSAKLLIKNLTEKIKLVVKETYEFEYRVKSIVITVFGKFDISEI